MAEITNQELLRSIQDGFGKAFRATDSILGGRYSMTGPSRLSAKFACEVGSAIHRCLQRRSPGLCLRVIGVDERGEKQSGEWLVDACITEEHCDTESLRFIDRIVFAMESESDTGKRAFNDDFAKLVHLNAEHKLYLNGLDQTTRPGMERYVESRCEYAEAVLQRTRPSGEFHLGFWPSPGKPKARGSSLDSIWRGLQCGEWPHLDGIRLWHFDKRAGKLIQVRPGGH